MAQDNITQATVNINSKLYDLTNLPVAQYVSRLPAKINTGGNDYNNQNFLDTWTIQDQTGGIGISEMDESVHATRSWWTNCITKWRNHMMLPRLATSISLTSATVDQTTAANLDFELTTLWTNGKGTWARTDTVKRSGTYSWKNVNADSPGSNDDYVYQDVTPVRPGATYTFTCYLKGSSAGDTFKLRLYDGISYTDGTTTALTTDWQQFTVSKTVATTATSLRLLVWCVAAATGHTNYVDDATLAATTPFTLSGTVGSVENFNSNLYFAVGKYIVKLASGRATLEFIGEMEATITKLTASVNSCLYVFMGDTTNYKYMSTAEVFTTTNVTDATYGVQWDQKLWKQDADGNWWHAATPNSATPSWTSKTGINDIASQIENLLIAPDASGDPGVYCATNSWLKLYDFTNNKWIDTFLKLPNHPNGGKGACYWHGAIYLSYGLGVKQYIPGSTVTISEVGLTRDDGLPVEYNGEIVKLLGESSSDLMFALVDASQVTGTGKSGVYAYDGSGWHCWWIDTANDAAMHDCIISSAASGYALYWDVGAYIYYIDIHRGISNPEQLAGTQKYATAGSYYSPWFDANAKSFSKLLKSIVTWAKGITTTETIAIYYRTNKTYTDIASGWGSAIETLDTTGENGVNTELLASGAGVEFNSFQIRLDFARGSTNTSSPDLQSIMSSYEVLTGADGNWIWTLTIPLNHSHGTSPLDKMNNLNTAIQLGTLVPIEFREGDTSEPYYCRLRLISAFCDTGHNYEGEYTIQAVKV